MTQAKRQIKRFTQQNHYEVLDILPDALPMEIHRAYKKAVALYEDNSIASYSFFSAKERREILACIETAYLTLINAEARANYDSRLTALGTLGERHAGLNRTKAPVAIFDFQKTSGYGPSPAQQPTKPKSFVEQDPVIQNILMQDTLAGADLQKLRTYLKVTLEEISHQTNIRIDILRAIEDENVDLLPPTVYLKGFLKAYLRCLALDEQALAMAYLKKIGKSDSLSPKQG